MAAVSVKVGSFNKTASPTNSQTVSWSDGDVFTPSVIMFFQTRENGFGDFVVAGEGAFVLGWANGVDQEFGISALTVDAVSTTVAVSGYQSAKIIGQLTGSNGVHEALGDISNVIDRSFDITWTTNTASTPMINFVAIGGPGIEETSITTQTLGTTTNDQTFAHGLATGAPDIVFFLIGDTNTTGHQSHVSLGFGAAMSSSNRWCTSISAATGINVAGNINAVRTQSTSSCLLSCANGNDFLDLAVDFVSSDATNVTLNATDTAGTTVTFGMLAIRGGNWAMGSTSKSTNPSTPVDQNIATGLAGSTKLLMMTTFGSAANASTLSDMVFNFGVATASPADERCIGVINNDSILPVQASCHASNTKLMRIGTIDASTYTPVAECDLKEFSGGNATVTWTTNDSSDHELLWVTLGGDSDKRWILGPH